MNSDCVVVLTFRGRNHIISDEGSSAWKLEPTHAARKAYVVCTRNAHSRHGVEGREEHGSAFIVGKIRDVVPARDPNEAADGRYLIRFSEFADIDVPNVWRKGDRNPVKYTKLAEIGIDPSRVDWKPMPERAQSDEPRISSGSATHSGALSLAEAKKGLAVTFNVPPEAIEITIRG